MNKIVFDGAWKNGGISETEEIAESSTINLPPDRLKLNKYPGKELLVPSCRLYGGIIHKDDQKDELEYLIDMDNPALVLIFNMVSFQNGYKKRTGSNLDVQQLIYIFTRQKITLERNNICDNLTRNEVIEKIKSICNEIETGQRNPSSLICIFLTHGDEDDSLCCKDGTISVFEIYTPFAKLKKLEGKPKLFIFQACKSNVSPLHDPAKYRIDETDHMKTVPLIAPIFWKINIPTDIIIAYSTLENEVSVRMEESGTWYIQELCKNIHGYAKRDDVHSILLRTNKCITTNHDYKVGDKIIFKQMPIFISTLTKKWFLNMSKDRQFLLRMEKQMGEILMK